MEKSTTCKVTGAVCTTVPFVPLMVRVKLDNGVGLEGATVSVDVPLLPVIVAGLKLVVVPAGAPVTVRATSPVNPLNAVLLTEYVVFPPMITACVAGVADKAIVGTAFTMRSTVVKRVIEPLVPVIVRV